MANIAHSASSDDLLLLAEFRRALVDLALSPNIRRAEVVLPSPAFLLVATTFGHQPGEKAEGLQANVSPPRRH